MKKPDIQRVVEFQKLLLDFSHIERVIHRMHKPTNSIVRENDTEHSYNLAMTAWFLAQHFPDLDRDLVIRLALVHDLVEVHAGDTYVLAEESELASKADREAAALVQLQSDWSDFPEMLQYIEDYEHRKSDEAKFVYALDKVLPIITIYINNGVTWKKEGITLPQLDAIKRNRVKVSPEIKPYYDQLYELLVQSPHLIRAK